MIEKLNFKMKLIQKPKIVIWKPVPLYPDYRVSEFGEVESFKWRKWMRINPFYKNGEQHPSVKLYKGGEYKKIIIPKLVATVYLDNPNNYKNVSYKDGNIHNYHYKNLLWTKGYMKNYDSKMPVESEDLKRIPDFPGYMVTKEGKIMSWKRNNVIEMKPSKNTGYLRVKLSNINVKKQKTIHRIVATSFKPNQDLTRPLVDHINTDKLNNHVDNLQWATHSENSTNIKCIMRKYTKPVIEYDDKGDILDIYKNAKEAAGTYGLSMNSMYYKLNSNTYPMWQYADEKYIPFKDEIFVEMIKEFEDCFINFPGYFISNYGNVINSKGIKLSQSFVEYYHCSIKGKKFSISRLVALFFVSGRTKEKNIANHIDENKKNNHASNLEWTTQAENVKHSIYKQYKKVKQIDKNGKVIKIFNSISEAAKAVLKPTMVSNISKVCKGKQSMAFGFKWEYA